MIDNYLDQLEKGKEISLSPAEVSGIEFPEGNYSLTLIYDRGLGEMKIPMGVLDLKALKIELDGLKDRPTLKKYNLHLQI